MTERGELIALLTPPGSARTACDVGGPLPRTLDALHLASAMILGDAMTLFVAYDHRLAGAAQDLGFVTACPGR